MSQQHGRGQDHGSGVSGTSALDVQTNVSASGLEHGVLGTQVNTGDETGASNETGSNVGQNGSVQVGGDENVKLLGPRNGLHGGVVDNHVAVLDLGVVGRNLLTGVSEQTIGELHNVGLVDGGDLVSVVLESKVKGESGNSLGLSLGDDLDGLNDTGDGGVLQTGVLSLGVLSDQSHVNALKSGLDTGNVLDENQRGEDIELSSQGNVERLVAVLLNGGVEDTLDGDLVSVNGSNGLLVTVEMVLADTGDVDNLPVNGDGDGLEDGLDSVSNLVTDTITGDEGHGVLGSVLLRLEHGSGVGSEGSLGESRGGLC